MPQKLLQVNLTFSIPRAELEAAWLQAAQPVADAPGLRWKIWLMNEAEHEAGGIYLFESEGAAQAYLDSPIVAALKASPAVSHISARLFDVLESHTAITRGPVTPEISAEPSVLHT
jgi:hypothetical protein